MKKLLKVIAVLVLTATLVIPMVACRSDEVTEAPTETEDPVEEVQEDAGTEIAEELVDGLPEGLYIDDNGNYRFTDTRTISVGVWNRVDEIDADATIWADFIREQMLEVHNIEVIIEPVPRWTEGEFQAALLSANAAPDIGYTFDAELITTMAEMGGMINLAPYLREYGSILPNLFDQVTHTNIFWNYYAGTDTLWSITGRRASEGIQHTNTFIREDWLEALDLPIPNSVEEFEETLFAFRDRANELPGVGETVRIYIPSEEEDEEGTYHETLLGEEEIIPYLIGQDVGWWSLGLIESFIPSDVTERDWFVHGFDDRRFMWEDPMRQSLRILNNWYHEGLMYDGFHMIDDQQAHDFIRLGMVGAFHSTWDQPYRPGDAWTRIMQENIGEDARYIPINPFENDAGIHQMYASGPTDRFVYFPTTNEEVIASLLYLDFMNRPETLNFLQFGIEGTHHQVLDGGIIEMLPGDDWSPQERFSGARNFDINPLMNGIWFDIIDQDRALASAALGYPGVEPELIMESFDMAISNSIVFGNAITRTRQAEIGMVTPLRDQRDAMMHRLIVSVTPEDFDAEFESEYQRYLGMGAAAILEERLEAWIETFGDVTEIPAVEVE
jgi:putative aldouronate transport system substrate-binding protein